MTIGSKRSLSNTASRRASSSGATSSGTVHEALRDFGRRARRHAGLVYPGAASRSGQTEGRPAAASLPSTATSAGSGCGALAELETADDVRRSAVVGVVMGRRRVVEADQVAADRLRVVRLAGDDPRLHLARVRVHARRRRAAGGESTLARVLIGRDDDAPVVRKHTAPADAVGDEAPPASGPAVDEHVSVDPVVLDREV